MNIEVHESFQIWGLFLDICPGVGSLDHIVALCTIFWGTPMLFSIVDVSVCNPTNSVGGFPIIMLM